MTITYISAKYIDADETTICAEGDDGSVISIPANTPNRYRDELVKQGITIAPYAEPEKTWEDVARLQSELLSPTSEVTWRIMRYQTQEALIGVEPTETEEAYQELLQYCEDVRNQDDNASLPQEADTTLRTLELPIKRRRPVAEPPKPTVPLEGTTPDIPDPVSPLDASGDS